MAHAGSNGHCTGKGDWVLQASIRFSQGVENRQADAGRDNRTLVAELSSQGERGRESSIFHFPVNKGHTTHFQSKASEWFVSFGILTWHKRTTLISWRMMFSLFFLVYSTSSTCASPTAKSRFHYSSTFLHICQGATTPESLLKPNVRPSTQTTHYSSNQQEKGERINNLNLVKKPHTSDKELMENKGANTAINCIKRDEAINSL